MEPVITLYVRLLVSCLSQSFLRHLKQTHDLVSLTVLGALEPSSSQIMNNVLPLSLERVVQLDPETNEIHRTEHPVSSNYRSSGASGSERYWEIATLTY